MPTPIPEHHRRAAAFARRFFKPVTYEVADGDSLQRRMLIKVYNAVATAPDGAIERELKRTIQSAAFAGLDGEDPDYGW